VTGRAALDLRLLGRFAARRDGVEIPPADFGGRKVRALVRMLAARQGAVVPNDVLAEWLWPDGAPAAPSSSSSSQSSDSPHSTAPVSKPTAVETPVEHEYTPGACYSDGSVTLPADAPAAGAPTCAPSAASTK
jgi:hypothetical protein